MIKTFFRRYWPLLAFFTVCAVAGAVLLIRAFLPGPEAAVKGYLNASLRYDVDEMLFYASDYQKKALAGNADIPEETLRANLKAFYESEQLQPENGEIDFLNVRVTDVEPGSARYDRYLTEYGYKADADAVDKLALVSLTCSVSGKRKTDYRVVAVKCGLRWYYGFITTEE